MFEHFHQFMSSSTTSSLPIPTLSFPLHPNPSFDSYAPPLHHPKQYIPKYPLNLGLDTDRSRDPWSNDEVLALLKVRSTMEIWFPDFTWEHVSRKLGELGFKRSGEECKNKFEEESTHFNNTNHNRILSELDEFYHAHEQAQEQADVVDQEKVEEESRKTTAAAEDEQVEKKAKSSMKKRKRRRRDKVEMLKGFCEAVVKTMMAKQEELHQKLIHDIIKRDEEKIAREEAWKAQEMDRFKSQIEIRSKEDKSAAERQATIIHFLKQFSGDNQLNNNNDNHSDTPNYSNSNSSASFSQIPQTDQNQLHQNPTTPFSPPQTNQNPTTKTPSPSSPTSSIPKPNEHENDVGKRWPRDEVVALINLRCKMSSVSNEEGTNPNSKGPLWERISQGMKEMGYKRNAKRCKEKWENINKYFRKTKDSSKKRSVNSRTCPYFHQLSCLYSDGTIVAPNQMPETYIATTPGPPAAS